MKSLRNLSAKIFLGLCMVQFFAWHHQVQAQRTILDVTFKDIYRPIRLWVMDLIGRTSEIEENRNKLRALGKLQNSKNPNWTTIEFCDTQNGPGRRSDERPESVHRLRPGDIDVVGAMGDSLTAGNGLFAWNVLQVAVENRGQVWSIGGQGSWREYLTIPNILKEFNPNLYGYSLKDGLSTDRSSKFNVAEGGAMSRDVPYEAKILVKRMRRDPRVNMTEDWKLVTLLISNNDFCSDACYWPRVNDALKAHERNMLKTYRYLRDNVPRLMLNVVPAPNLSLLTKLKGFTPLCLTLRLMECSCLTGQTRGWENEYEDFIKRWIAKDFELANRDEFNTETFTINVQPFTQINTAFQKPDGNTDLRLLSADCFHLSQRGNAFIANTLWNNMLEDPDNKSLLSAKLFETFLCPTKERPYLITRVNSKKDFKV